MKMIAAATMSSIPSTGNNIISTKNPALCDEPLDDPAPISDGPPVARVLVPAALAVKEPVDPAEVDTVALAGLPEVDGIYFSKH